MKRILAVLIFVAVFGMLMSSAAAADMLEHDFDGKCKVQIPDVGQWMGDQVPFGDGIHGGGISIHYFTNDDLNGESVDDLIDSENCDEVKTDGNLTVYKMGEKYAVLINTSDEYLIVKDKNLEEAKAIASSADFLEDKDKTPSQNNSKTEVSSNSSDVEMERVPVNEYMTIEAPKGCEFDNGTYDGFWVTYYGSEFDGIVYYANEDSARAKIDDAYYDNFINNITSHDGVKSHVEGDVTIVEGIQNIDGTNAGYVHGDNEMAIVISNDLNLVKEMAKTVEFTK